MNPDNIPEYLNFARTLISVSRNLIIQKFNRKFRFSLKKDKSIVTELDVEIEQSFRHLIQNSYPRHGIIGEEFEDTNSEADYVWVIDPIDGTQELFNNLPTFGTMVCLLYKKNPVIGIIDHPILDICLYAGLGTGGFNNTKQIILSETNIINKPIILPARADFKKLDQEDELFYRITDIYDNYRVFRSCYGHTLTILGHTSLTIEHDVRLWDIAASQILVNETGGKFVVLRERAVTGSNTVYSVAFGHSKMVDHAVAHLAPYYNEIRPCSL